MKTILVVVMLALIMPVMGNGQWNTVDGGGLSDRPFTGPLMLQQNNISISQVLHNMTMIIHATPIIIEEWL